MASMDSFGLDVGIYGANATPETVLSLTTLAEDTGFGSVWLADHVAFPVSFKSEYPYAAKGQFPTKLDDPLLEPVATMGVLVGATKRVRIGVAVLIMPYRNPLLLARMIATLDQFSGGRIDLGAGVGWLEEEFEALGSSDFARRGKVTDEAIEIFKAVCAGGEVGYQGETYEFAPIYANPGSIQRPHPPVLIGGLTNPALRRVARHGTGWLAVMADPVKLTERLAKLRELMTAAGRSFDALSLHYKMFLAIDNPKHNTDGVREPGTGSKAEIIDDLKRLRELGFTNIIVRYRGSDAQQLTRQINEFVSDIVPKV
ncbi:MAG: putative F420-dependent oxidoreductase [Hyphomicrobiaceae bacterium]|jgi:probable F420-dependent oxidoreductase